MTEIKLRCCTCGEEKPVTVEEPPTFGFELLKIAQSAGWYPILDGNWGRALVFCSKSCYEAQLTKEGYVRKRLIQKPKEVPTAC